ncbi:MAG: lysylphosphatidylglycerol synthase domain-containing protein, partial [Synechococcus sp. ELA619]
GLAALGLAPLLLLRPRWFRPLLLRLERRRQGQLQRQGWLVEEPEPAGEANDPQGLSLEPAATGALLQRYPLGPLVGELAFVLVRFSGFACCVLAFDVAPLLPWNQWLGGFALAWTLGLVVPGAPGGLGVFEAALLLRLGGLVPEAPLLAIALSYRLVTSLADLLGAATAELDQRWFAGR